ncbi:hypothetical protein Syun_024648 [Stephania yunnanensis]|uniref:Uncharacterized protein n=1 Tax=Stephania yunnanensis TaxID=152371 RepID=A0AAP0NHM2_9MAGN
MTTKLLLIDQTKLLELVEDHTKPYEVDKHDEDWNHQQNQLVDEYKPLPLTDH